MLGAGCSTTCFSPRLSVIMGMIGTDPRPPSSASLVLLCGSTGIFGEVLSTQHVKGAGGGATSPIRERPALSEACQNDDHNTEHRSAILETGLSIWGLIVAACTWGIWKTSLTTAESFCFERQGPMTPSSSLNLHQTSYFRAIEECHIGVHHQMTRGVARVVDPDQAA
ncbi:hypothetical protein LX32DRAFT_98871 [Colletotrichum zoysiae]|uniref:Uncharacterized protein n=1 Tax=Colletotrichum zoysiae TaxID=1216348 RepID=A0AAD9M003_9PEZI|nr:hypothetical protein LX32DRAFT_98871 [Colletotrichum zoysiae]